MNKKIMLLALAAISSAMFAMPSLASAELLPLHMTPTPAKLDMHGVGKTILRSSGGTITCNGLTSASSATPEAGGTTGTMTLRFGGECKHSLLGTCTSSSPADSSGFITTTPLPYHLVTIDTGVTPASPGVLVTPGSGGAFAHFNCGFAQVTVEGNGVLGTITSPACGGTSSTATISFLASPAGSTTQQHRFTEGSTAEKTTGPWSLSVGGNPASMEAHATLTATDAKGISMNTTLSCK